ncbi:phosphate acyltransferase PlsX [Geothermobacter hydrogeniphilus]|uniref:Phosphate acyltransferase n=1 Tax=Geothermobacter hydrogeniphilus TaxID=1969733 RepID=A0A2K2H8J6_9BACT|nr:phosphate acyltransferase PlsX [Geothermobacter hydrogeniphilus]PNU19569.1 phosphate acyltransferase PlsX [Geothermobacter hydrogeniphilus]
MVVAVDAMGGDNAPVVEVAGAVEAARRWDIPVILVGNSERVSAELSRHRVEGLDISIRHASEVVGMHDSPSDVVRKKKDSSVRVAFDLVKNGDAHAVVSAGNSGATMAAAMFVLKRIKGIDRPAIATVMPNLLDQTLVLDAGGNVDCRPQHLAQFALMGAVYSRHILGKRQPRVGLLSNGEEESKGTDLTRGAHNLLKKAGFNYVGYVEGRDIYNGSVDVVVCDGFVGNVVLKASEGLADAIGTMLKQELKSSLRAKLGYLLARPAFRRLRKKIDYAEYGGAPLLGIAGTGMICHGGSNAKAVMNGIRLARESVVRRVNENMVAALQGPSRG